MKKTLKRLGAMFLSMIMAVSVLSVGAFATDSKTGSITLETTSSGQSYYAYQLFKGDVTTTADGEKVLTNIGWGNGTDPTSLCAALVNETSSVGKYFGCRIWYKDAIEREDEEPDYEIEDDAVAQNIVAILSSNEITNDGKEWFAKVTADVGDRHKEEKTILEEQKSADGKTTGYRASGLEPGYYVVTDGKSMLVNNGSIPNLVLVDADGTTITPKSAVPTVDKEIVADNEEKSAVTASIGDTVEFKLTGTLPYDYDAYSTYKYEFQDTLSTGLTYNDDVKVYVKNGEEDEVEIKGYTVDKTSDTSINVTFTDLKSGVTAAADGGTVTIDKDSKIIVKYSATLNANAEIGTTGNTNKVKLEYSDDTSSGGTGTTPESYVKVYTTGLRLEKIDAATQKALTGATFTIEGTGKRVGVRVNYTYTVDENGTYYKLTDTGTYTTTEPTEDTKSKYEVSEEGTENYVKYMRKEVTAKDDASTSKFAATATVGDDGVLVIKGLGAGSYFITEITAPSGYNLLTDPISITIEEKNVTKDSCEWTVLNNGANVDPNSDNLYTFQVANKQGSTLPSTGGMGTTLFYVVGALLMAGAAIVLVIKKRRSSAE